MTKEDSVQRVRNLVLSLESRIEGNARVPTLMAACAIAQEPLWLVGDTGLAKTTMGIEFFESLDLPRGKANGYFEKTLHPYSEPGDLFGPIDFKRLTGSDKSEYYRLTEGFLPSARAALLDEFTLAPQELLQSLLHLLQHRVYHNGQQMELSPLTILVVASNEIPATRQLRALVNRLPLRVVAERITDAKACARVLQKSLALWGNRLDRANAMPHQRVSVCRFEDFQACMELIKPSPLLTDDFREVPFVKKYVALLQSLGSHQDEIIHANPRTQLKAYLVMRALALLRRGNPDPQDEELRVLEHLFEQPEDQAQIADELNAAKIPDWFGIPKP